MLAAHLRQQASIAKYEALELGYRHSSLTHQGQWEPEELAQLLLARPARPLPLSLLPPHPACAWCLQAAARRVDELMPVPSTHRAAVGTMPSKNLNRSLLASTNAEADKRPWVPPCLVPAGTCSACCK